MRRPRKTDQKKDVVKFRGCGGGGGQGSEFSRASHKRYMSVFQMHLHQAENRTWYVWMRDTDDGHELSRTILNDIFGLRIITCKWETAFVACLFALLGDCPVYSSW